MPEKAWFFSLRMGDFCCWKDQAALKRGIKNQRYLQNIPSGILCGSDEVKIAQRKCQSCDTLRNTQPIKVLVWAQRSFTSWIALCRSHSAVFFLPLICWFIKHSVHVYWGVKTYIPAAVNYGWVGLFEHQTMWISAVKNKVSVRFSWDKYQVFNMEGNVKNKTRTAFFR